MELVYLALFALAVFFFCRASHFYACRHKAEAEKMAAEAKSAALKLLREVAFDAISYAAEEAAKARKDGSIYRPETKLQSAVEFVMRKLPDVEYEDAADMVESVLAKIPREGATKNEVIR